LNDRSGARFPLRVRTDPVRLNHGTCGNRLLSGCARGRFRALPDPPRRREPARSSAATISILPSESGVARHCTRRKAYRL